MRPSTSHKRGAKVEELSLTPLELIDRIAALVALATPAQTVTVQGAPTNTGEGSLGVVLQGHDVPSRAEPAQPVPPKRPAQILGARVTAVGRLW